MTKQRLCGECLPMRETPPRLRNDRDTKGCNAITSSFREKTKKILFYVRCHSWCAIKLAVSIIIRTHYHHKEIQPFFGLSGRKLTLCERIAAQIPPAQWWRVVLWINVWHQNTSKLRFTQRFPTKEQRRKYFQSVISLHSGQNEHILTLTN